MRNQNRPSRRPKFFDKEFTLKEIEQALRRLANEGRIVDSGERRWSERSGRYEIVWKLPDNVEKLPLANPAPPPRE
jgi:hypothetical protein